MQAINMESKYIKRRYGGGRSLRTVTLLLAIFFFLYVGHQTAYKISASDIGNDDHQVLQQQQPAGGNDGSNNNSNVPSASIAQGANSNDLATVQADLPGDLTNSPPKATSSGIGGEGEKVNNLQEVVNKGNNPLPVYPGLDATGNGGCGFPETGNLPDDKPKKPSEAAVPSPSIGDKEKIHPPVKVNDEDSPPAHSGGDDINAEAAAQTSGGGFTDNNGDGSCSSPETGNLPGDKPKKPSEAAVPSPSIGDKEKAHPPVKVNDEDSPPAHSGGYDINAEAAAQTGGSGSPDNKDEKTFDVDNVKVLNIPNSQGDSNNTENQLECYKFDDDGSQVTKEDVEYNEKSNLYEPKTPRKLKVSCGCGVKLSVNKKENEQGNANKPEVVSCEHVIVEQEPTVDPGKPANPGELSGDTGAGGNANKKKEHSAAGDNPTKSAPSKEKPGSVVSSQSDDKPSTQGLPASGDGHHPVEGGSPSHHPVEGGSPSPGGLLTEEGPSPGGLPTEGGPSPGGLPTEGGPSPGGLPTEGGPSPGGLPTEGGPSPGGLPTEGGPSPGGLPTEVSEPTGADDAKNKRVDEKNSASEPSSGSSGATTQQPSDDGSSGSMGNDEVSYTLRGKGHDKRTPGDWIGSDQNRASLESCKALSNDDNLRNPMLYLNNLARCLENVNTPLKWSSTLARDATDLSHAAFDYAERRSSTKEGRKLSTGSGLGGSPHLPIPHTGEDGIRSDSIPTGQNISIGHLFDTLFTGTKSQELYQKFVSGGLSINDLVIDVSGALSKGSESGSSIISSVYDAVKKGSDPQDNETLRKIINTPVPNGVPVPVGEYEFVPVSYLASKYLGGLDGDIGDATMSLGEYYAVLYFNHMYIREGTVIENEAGQAMRRNIGNAVFDSNTFHSGNSPTGHFTQMIWGASTEIGCGTVYKDGEVMTTCSYFPSGNIIGQKVNDPSKIDSNAKNILFDSNERSIAQSIGGFPKTGSMRAFLAKFYEARNGRSGGMMSIGRRAYYEALISELGHGATHGVDNASGKTFHTFHKLSLLSLFLYASILALYGLHMVSL